MGLRSDIEDALFKSMGEPEDKGNVPQLAEGIADAVINFLTKQTFTITEMKSILEVEEISTTGPLQADVLSTVITAHPSGNVVKGTNGVLIPKVSFKKDGGQGGAMKAVGHAYIGRNPVDSEESNEDLTKVKLLDDNIVER